MNITPSQNTLQAFGSAFASTSSATQTRQPVAAEPAARPEPNATQRADAAPRAEAPARADADSRPPSQATGQQDRPGSKLDIVV